jgi:hypothetical protein
VADCVLHQTLPLHNGRVHRLHIHKDRHGISVKPVFERGYQIVPATSGFAPELYSYLPVQKCPAQRLVPEIVAFAEQAVDKDKAPFLLVRSRDQTFRNAVEKMPMAAILPDDRIEETQRGILVGVPTLLALSPFNPVS